MRIDFGKLEMAQANAARSCAELDKAAKLSPGGFKAYKHRAKKGKDFLPKTIGRLARALKCRPEDLICKSE